MAGQEKACCLPAYAAAQELRRLRQREPELRGSVLQVGAGSGRSLAHLHSLLPDQENITRLLAMAGDRSVDGPGLKGWPRTSSGERQDTVGVVWQDEYS